jgi:hypothetical protein
MNYLVVLNIGDYMCSNVRESLNHACNRWGIKMLEQTVNYNSHIDLCFSKLMGIRSMMNDYPDMRGVLYMDSDMLIRDDAPNPFELFTDRSKVYAVKDYDDTRWSKNSESYENVKNEVSTPWVKRAEDLMKWGMPEEDINDCPSWFVNAGMFLLYVPESLPEVELFISNLPTVGPSRYEQALWNYILRVRRKTEFISSKWNTINPDVSSGSMTSYIYHFTGIPSIVDSVKKLERTFNWRTS